MPRRKTINTRKKKVEMIVHNDLPNLEPERSFEELMPQRPKKEITDTVSTSISPEIIQAISTQVGQYVNSTPTLGMFKETRKRIINDFLNYLLAAYESEKG